MEGGHEQLPIGFCFFCWHVGLSPRAEERMNDPDFQPIPRKERHPLTPPSRVRFFLRSTRVTRPWRSFWKAPVRSVLPTSRASWTSRTAKRIRPATEGREGGRCGFKSDDATAKPK